MTVTSFSMPSAARETGQAPVLTLTPVSPDLARITAQDPSTWTAADLCLYVTEEISRIHGEQLPAGDYAPVIEDFYGRFGAADAVRIARRAFEVHLGMWHGAPVTIRRFQEGHDGFFARPLLSCCS